LKKEEWNRKKVILFIFLLALTIISLAIGCIFFCLSKYYSTNTRVKILIFAYLPFLIFFQLLIICCFKCSIRKSQILLSIISFILTFFLPAYYLSGMFICSFELAENPITDVKYYKDIVRGSYLKAFPDEIPNSVEKVHFIFSPGAL